ncbi:hypothetical protein HWQ46_26860 [Shewanella sp. D64]|uniref:hypothetical protein n=1 Tax=unclassified Shewanella TaxID=196818 RepID=UPI0022BA1324|nr:MULTISPECIES: hypothetical protein [unclassified Shewanella]MEC4729128.1 hypothetical protein [Shewanella sp. D64]MEC4740928.1 hypothetical protein [Shewanella sp. E94]WBJ97071.1 hypothetical protein HWQ47_08180 [Shewanella sp. MTB7]
MRNSGPLFKTNKTKNERKSRSKIIGSYEWALKQSWPKSSSKFRSEVSKNYDRIKLENEIIRLENEIAFGHSITGRSLNRQIVLSKVLSQRIAKDSQLAIENKRKDKIEAEAKELRAQKRRDQAQGSALGDSFDKRYSIFMPGGAPGLGKRS